MPILCIVFCLIALKKFTMTKKDHALIRAAIAAKKKYGAVILTSEQIRICEKISGQPWETMWISQAEPDAAAHAPEIDAQENFTLA